MKYDFLQKLGLTESEIKVYIALLRIGQSSTGTVVERAKVTRSKIYDILGRLQEKGLVTYIIKDSTKNYMATNPEHLKDILDKRMNLLLEQKNQLSEAIPQLLSLYEGFKDSKIAEIFIGKKGFKNAFLELAKEFEPQTYYYAIGGHNQEHIKEFSIFFTKYQRMRENKGVNTKIIFNQDIGNTFQYEKKSRQVQVRYLNQQFFTSTNIYKNNIILLILSAEPITILIRSKEVAESFLKQFNYLWNISTVKS